MKRLLRWLQTERFIRDDRRMFIYFHSFSHYLGEYTLWCVHQVKNWIVAHSMMSRSSCTVFNLHHAPLVDFMFRLHDSSDLKTIHLVGQGWNFLSVSRPAGAQIVLLLRYFSGVVWHTTDIQMSQHVVSVELSFALLQPLSVIFCWL